ncbi:MAG: hypothetical protein AAFX06_17540 [Planctomycetota bacterium]
MRYRIVIAILLVFFLCVGVEKATAQGTDNTDLDFCRLVPASVDTFGYANDFGLVFENLRESSLGKTFQHPKAKTIRDGALTIIDGRLSGIGTDWETLSPIDIRRGCVATKWNPNRLKPDRVVLFESSSIDEASEAAKKLRQRQASLTVWQRGKLVCYSTEPSLAEYAERELESVRPNDSLLFASDFSEFRSLLKDSQGHGDRLFLWASEPMAWITRALGVVARGISVNVEPLRSEAENIDRSDVQSIGGYIDTGDMSFELMLKADPQPKGLLSLIGDSSLRERPPFFDEIMGSNMQISASWDPTSWTVLMEIFDKNKQALVTSERKTVLQQLLNECGQVNACIFTFKEHNEAMIVAADLSRERYTADLLKDYSPSILPLRGSPHEYSKAEYPELNGAALDFLVWSPETLVQEVNQFHLTVFRERLFFSESWIHLSNYLSEIIKRDEESAPDGMAIRSSRWGKDEDFILVAQGEMDIPSVFEFLTVRNFPAFDSLSPAAREAGLNQGEFEFLRITDSANFILRGQLNADEG